MKISVQDTLNLLNIIIEPLFPVLARHQQRTAYIALCLARELQQPPESVRCVYMAANLHDIGVLGKKYPGLTEASLESESVLRHHEALGVSMSSGIRFLKPVIGVLKHHHICWDSAEPNKYPIENHLVAFADRFELYLRKCPSNYIVSAQGIVSGFIERYPALCPHIYPALQSLARKDEFWFHLESDRLYSVLKLLSPLNDVTIDSEDFLEVCLLISRMVDKYSSFTVTHSTSVANVACVLGRVMGLSPTEQKELAIAGYLHDIGKIHIPLHILEKKGSLTDQEYALIRKHSYKTWEILTMIKPLHKLGRWASSHHERLDGSGYPFGLMAADLCLPSRILAVADVFSALTENRPYRQGISAQKALHILDSEVRRHKLDKQVVNAVRIHIDAIYACVLKT
ncbi:HD domain-containing protein [Enterobacteriaceae bacterium 4M9]|nr:HD domain-containing protein [Enterobacteriaceae bacterium 4M9]